MRDAHKNDLSGRLDAYSATLRSSRVDETRRRRSLSWQVYAAVTGSALAMATNASAGLIVNSNLNVTAGTLPNVSGLPGGYVPGASGSYWRGPRTAKTATVNLTNGTGKKIGVSFHIGVQQEAGDGYRNGMAWIGKGTGVNGFLALSGNVNTARNLSSGAKQGVSAGDGLKGNFKTSPWLATQHLSGDGGPGHGQPPVNSNQSGGSLSGGGGYFKPAKGNIQVANLFTSGQPGYAGFSFNYNGHADYGWVKLEFTEGTNGLANSITAYSAGFYDASPTPEPSTGALAILAAGAAGVIALRRRKKPA